MGIIYFDLAITLLLFAAVIWLIVRILNVENYLRELKQKELVIEQEQELARQRNKTQGEMLTLIMTMVKNLSGNIDDMNTL